MMEIIIDGTRKRLIKKCDRDGNIDIIRQRRDSANQPWQNVGEPLKYKSPALNEQLKIIQMLQEYINLRLEKSSSFRDPEFRFHKLALAIEMIDTFSKQVVTVSQIIDWYNRACEMEKPLLNYSATMIPGGKLGDFCLGLRYENDAQFKASFDATGPLLLF